MGDELVKVLERLLANREMLHDVHFESPNAIAFVIGINPKVHVLEYVERDDRWNQPCFLLDRMRLEYCEGNPLWEALEKMGRDTLARTLERDMSQEVLVSPEQNAEMRNLEDGLGSSAFVVRHHSGRYWVRYKATCDDIEVFEDYNSALQRARKLNAEHYGFQRQQEGDAR